MRIGWPRGALPLTDDGYSAQHLVSLYHIAIALSHNTAPKAAQLVPATYSRVVCYPLLLQSHTCLLLYSFKSSHPSLRAGEILSVGTWACLCPKVARKFAMTTWSALEVKGLDGRVWGGLNRDPRSPKLTFVRAHCLANRIFVFCRCMAALDVA
jgi:hypothetical protein